MERKAMRIGLLILTALLAGNAIGEVVGREVSYRGDGLEMQGYLSWDDSITAPRPGVLVVHEWWGLNGYTRDRARQLAAAGYVALAVDMYGGGRNSEHPDEAGAFMKEALARSEGLQQRFGAALELLRADPHTRQDDIAAIGYCFGGSVVLNMARAGLDLDGVISFHGGLEPLEPARQGAVEAEVLVLNGAADPMVPAEQIASFKQEMTAAGVNYTFIDYPGVLHGFTNPAADALAEQTGLPLGYDAHADHDSWQRMLDFFNRIFED